jgi:phage terminase Nu1 subunit (DNA packaging protein)
MSELDIIVTTRQLAAFYSVSIRTIQIWYRNGAPKLGRNKVNLRLFNQWWLETIIGLKNGSGEDLLTARTKYWMSKAEREAHQVAQLKGSVYLKDDVHGLWSARVSVVKNGLLQLANRLPPMLEGKDKKQIASIVEFEAMELLKSYTQPSSLYTPFSGIGKKANAKEKQ